MTKSVLKVASISECCVNDDEFIRLQWQNAARSTSYVVYRWIIATIYTLTNTFAIYNHLATGGTWANYFAYLTNLGNTTCMAVTLLGAVSITYFHRNPVYLDEVKSLQDMPRSMILYWRLHNVTLLVAVIVTSFYWTVVFQDMHHEIDTTDVATHIFNICFVLLDSLIMQYPIKVKDVWLPLQIGLAYAVFLWAYYQAGGVNKKGQIYVYKQLDWSKPGEATISSVFMLLVISFVFFIILWFSRLRIYVHRKVVRHQISKQMKITF